jgi:hypothetical protein
VERPGRFGRDGVDVVPHLIDLARHLAQHFGVLVFEAQLEGFGAGIHSKYHRVCDAQNHRPYRPVRSNLGLYPEACRSVLVNELHLRLAYGPAFEGVLQKAQGQQGR